MNNKSKWVVLCIVGEEYMFDKKACGRRLKQLRMDKNMHQDEVATEMGISADTVSKLEQGKRSPSATMVCILANYYKTTADYILFGVARDGCAGNEWISELSVDKRRRVERMIEELKGLVE
ncbi:MAG: helix-turn-helix transcriptional regulator [Lachnospiraceae bacterium]|nr:helix-turn-helix transcriptional regulator [Lachnospiraceae bacterium]